MHWNLQEVERKHPRFFQEMKRKKSILVDFVTHFFQSERENVQNTTTSLR